jgi:hypothetical protein
MLGGALAAQTYMLLHINTLDTLQPIAQQCSTLSSNAHRLAVFEAESSHILSCLVRVAPAAAAAAGGKQQHMRFSDYSSAQCICTH